MMSCASWVVRWAAGRPFVHLRKPGNFTFEGRDVPYVHAAYNHTWLNERGVELALAHEVAAGYEPERVLEIGNVLGRYQPVRHSVIDKYERAPGVLNFDVTEAATDNTYDLVLSVSTLEHVGWDEAVLDPAKPERAIARLKSMLAPGGLMWITLPVGYNPHLDEQLRAGRYGFTRTRALVRSRRNTWRQVPLAEVWTAEYDRLTYTAHGLVIAEYREPGAPLLEC